MTFLTQIIIIFRVNDLSHPDLNKTTLIFNTEKFLEISTSEQFIHE